MPTRDNPRMLRLLWDKCEVGCATVDKEGRFLAVNDRFCSIVEYTEAELVGTHFKEITLPSDAGADMEMARSLYNGDRDHYRMVKTYIKKSGYPVQIELVVWPVEKEDGGFEFFLSQIVPRVNIRSASEVTVEPVLVMWRALTQNKKVILACLGTVTVILGALAGLFDLLRSILDNQ